MPSKYFSLRRVMKSFLFSGVRVDQWWQGPAALGVLDLRLNAELYFCWMQDDLHQDDGLRADRGHLAEILGAMAQFAHVHVVKHHVHLTQESRIEEPLVLECVSFSVLSGRCRGGPPHPFVSTC